MKQRIKSKVVLIEIENGLMFDRFCECDAAVDIALYFHSISSYLFVYLLRIIRFQREVFRSIPFLLQALCRNGNAIKMCIYICLYRASALWTFFPWQCR